MRDAQDNALDVVAERGDLLRTRWRFDWPAPVQQAVHRSRLWHGGGGDDPDRTNKGPFLVAITGGASSGKSTVYNNLLEGHLASRITARGHATLGPILAVHEQHRELVESLIETGRLLPGFRRIPVELDENTPGEVDAMTILFHTVDSLADVLLFDLPDHTSESAYLEGDVSLSLLPWFDRLLVVVDHERWFDRQSISHLRNESARFGQQRWVLFNRTREGPLEDSDRLALSRQAQRLSAAGSTTLEFRRGRGFTPFPPAALDDVVRFLQEPPLDRDRALSLQIAEAANRVLNQCEERSARLAELHESLDAAIERTLPTTRECLFALMTPPERRQLEPVSRVLRLHETKEWVTTQTQRLRKAVNRLPLVGAFTGGVTPERADGAADRQDRSTIAAAYFETIAKRQVNEIQRVERGGRFWDEIRRWTGLEPSQRALDFTGELREEVAAAAQSLDSALVRWFEKAEAECRGVAPHVTGAIGASSIGLVVALVAAPGPVAALTLITAKGAIGAALSQLAVAGGAGALLGKPMGRLMNVACERLLGSEEFQDVQAAADALHNVLASHARQIAADANAEATALVMPTHDPLRRALEELRQSAEDS